MGLFYCSCKEKCDTKGALFYNYRLILAIPSSSVKYCTQCICIYGIAKKSDVQTLVNFRCMLRVAVRSVTLWQRCSALSTFGFVDHVMFLHSGQAKVTTSIKVTHRGLHRGQV